MFERLKKVLLAQSNPKAGREAVPDAVSEWAGIQGFSYSGIGTGNGFALKGKVANKIWKLERGGSSRDYIHGEELRARADLGINDGVAVLIMNRQLKEALEKRTYAMYTDTLQTTVDPSLPEEMRWLAMYPEVNWGSLNPEFSARYAVMADQREHALAWVDASLADALMSWPAPGTDEQVPFVLMLLRGKAYLRMQYTPTDIPTLAHSAMIFTSACESAVGSLGTDIAL